MMRDAISSVSIFVLSYSRIVRGSGSGSKQYDGKLCLFRITCAMLVRVRRTHITCPLAKAPVIADAFTFRLCCRYDQRTCHPEVSMCNDRPGVGAGQDLEFRKIAFRDRYRYPSRPLR
jgi:hypothetical protein